MKIPEKYLNLFSVLFSQITRHAFVLGLAVILISAFILLSLYEPFWQTNDDPIFAMLINGYGLAAEPAINILNGNFLWAMIVRLIPDFLDISNYVWLQYFFVLSSILIIWRNLCINKGIWPIKLLFVLNLLFYAFLFPQYTVTAYYCSLAGVLSFISYINYAKPGGPKLNGLLAASLLFSVLFFLFFGFLIREMAFFSTLLLGIFIYPIPYARFFRIGGHSQKSFRQAPVLNKKYYVKIIAVFVLLGAGVACITMINSGLKKSENWDYINEWQKIRQGIADREFDNFFINQPELLNRYGLTPNDFQLLQHHFSADAGLRKISEIEAIKREAPGIAYLTQRIDTSFKSVSYLFDGKLELYSFFILLLFIKRYDRKTLFMLLAFLAYFGIIGFFNRGGVAIERVYYSLSFVLSAFLLMICENGNLKNIIFIKKGLYDFLLALALVSGILGFSKASIIQQWQTSRIDLPASGEYLNGSFWFGYPYPLEAIYRPFAKVSESKKINFQAGGWSALLPNSVAYFDVFDPDGFKNYFKNGFKLAAGKQDADLLGAYCKERLNGDFVLEHITPPNVYPVYFAQCRGKGEATSR